MTGIEGIFTKQMSNELDNLIQGIEKVVSWYSGLGPDFKDGQMLTAAKRKLCGLSFRFSTLVGDALENYNNSYSFRKKHLAEKKLEYVESGDTIGKAEMKAELLNYKFRVDEGSNEALYRKVKLQFDICRDTISSMQQDLSILRKELEDAKVHN